MDLEIRRGTESNLPDILRLYAQPGMDNGRVLTLEAATQVFRRMSTYPNYRIYVAARDRRTVGTFALLIMDNLAHMGSPSAVIEDFCVAEPLRGQGIGRTMMKFAMEIAREHGCYKFSLSSNAAREHAHAFYRSLGFEQHGVSFHVELSRPNATLSPKRTTPHDDAASKVLERS
jgi:GNAT superfamily N-acetyltransferase